MTTHGHENEPYNGAQLPSASNYIRLLHVSPSGQADVEAHHQAPIVCDFIVEEITSPTPYKALSYTWGDVSRPWPCWATIGGSEVPITRSLDTAIRYVRHQTEMTTIWIDQLCINQADNAEKNDQVLLMTKIYGKAEEVLAWLGPEADGSDAVMDAFHLIGSGARELDLPSYLTRERLPILMAIFRADEADPADETAKKIHELQDKACKLCAPILLSIGHWCKRTYFDRIWVVQEFALGKETTFVCGKKRVSRLDVMLSMQVLKSSVRRFENFTEMYKDFGPLLDEPTPAFFGAWRRRQKFELGIGKGDELFNLLRSLHTENKMLSSDARDRVYGLLGLAVDVDKLGIRPDYTNSTFQSVVTEAANAIVRTGRLELLSYSQYPKNDNDLPSWVPDWRPTLRPSYYTIRENAEPHLYSASGTTEPTILSTTDPRILGLEGYLVDTIELIGSTWWDEGWDHSRYLAFLSQVILLTKLSAAKPDTVYDTPVQLAEAAWRVPIADLFEEEAGTQRVTPEAVTSYEACLELCEMFEGWKLVKSDAWEVFEEKLGERRETANRYRASMATVNAMRPFLTPRGYLGLGATLSRVGDLIVIFKGSRIPYVIRPLGEDRQFQFIGEAFCHGVMDGEIVDCGTAEEFYLV